jgi:hypothetical protein
VSGLVYPAFGVVYAKGIDSFSSLDPHTRRHNGDRVALWLFIISIVSTVTIGVQNYMFAAAAATLTAKLRSLSFRAILRQDSESLQNVCIAIGLSNSLAPLQSNSLTRMRTALVVLRQT